MNSQRKCLKNPSIDELMEFTSDQRKGLPFPPIQKPYPADAVRLDLVKPEDFTCGNVPLINAINNRRSHRNYKETPLSLEELSFLLWSTQGIQKIIREGVGVFRTVPSGGARHPFETYLVIDRVQGIEPGLYRYLGVEHQLLRLEADYGELKASIVPACYGQAFAGTAAVVFVWSAIPYRTEWRYGPDSLKDILMSVGHICQNLYLACEAIHAGTCAVVSYDQDMFDQIIGADGREEITLYVAPVGKI